MTVITKPLTGEKKDKAPLVLPVHPQSVDPEVGGKPRLSERHYHILRQRAAGNRTGQWLVMFMIGLFMFFIVCGMFFVYQGMTTGRHQKWRGWCNVPYYKESPQLQQRVDSNDLFGYVNADDLVKTIDKEGLLGTGKDPDAESLRSFFREEFEIDLDEEKYSKIEVPDFKNGRLGRFIHEFDSNKTAIVDQTGMRCFIMPLDRKQILPPRSMYDMIEKMWKGYYSVNTQRVRENMRVVQPPIDDLSDLGEYIQQECEDKVTYRLEKATDRIVKRSVEGQKAALPFTEFTGLYQIEYDIVNLDQLESH